jgi:hypothetical protein
MLEKEDLQVFAGREETDEFVAAVATKTNDTDTGAHD